MTFNSLLMFDIVFVFFLFLVGVTCLVYYLPPSQHAIANYSRHSCKFIVDDEPEFDSRSLKSTATAAVGNGGGAEATEFEYQIETNNGCAPGQTNLKTWNREREEEQDRQQRQQQSHEQFQQQHVQQHQEQHHHHHHHHQYSNSGCCKNSDTTESPYSMRKFNANKKFHSNDDDMNTMHDVDFQLSMTNEKYNPNGLPRQQMQTEFRNPPSFCYIKAKYREIKHITGPIQSV